ncbi:hypothetical protein JCGZ_15931 [Jatropha curcas]|uniref:PB1 domain-containing protein n=1 Tax=Jatropha curcas TaxID=180498 RepID=A0A067LBN6_JATCU|nr:hypothetical protein JCGZ_15931 [Jatropha curcas]
MENLSQSYSSYPESGDSSPRSRDIDESQSWDDQPSNYKVKFMCSYGGKIQPRHHDNQLAYIGGDTKILAVERNVNFSVIMNKLTSLCGDADICFKYQLPGEDLDALISVTNDEDLEHMMLEYDRLYRASAKPARLRLFLFHLNPSSFGSDEMKSERQWFVDALNSVPVQNPEVSSPPPAAVAAAVSAGNPDFLFGFDKGFATVPASKFIDMAPPAPPTVPEIVCKDVSAGSECGSEDRHVISDPVVNQQIPEFQRLQIATNDQTRKIEDVNNRGYAVEYYAQKVTDKIAPPPTQVAMPVLMQVPAGYLPERHMTSAGYAIPAPGTEQTVYHIPTAGGIYQASAFRPVTGQVGQGYYGVQRVVQEVYREQPLYNPVPPPATAASLPQQQGVGVVQAKVGVAEQGYVQVGYDSAGRQVYYTTTQYQAATAPAPAPGPVVGLDSRQGGGAGALNPDGKVQVTGANVKAPQTTTV